MGLFMSFRVRSSARCCVCLAHHVVETPYSREEFEERIKRYQNGALIQNAFPELTDNQREILLSGTCERGWNKLFDPREE